MPRAELVVVVAGYRLVLGVEGLMEMVLLVLGFLVEEVVVEHRVEVVVVRY